jgi:alkylation response protein AidB-like acyl-CoA dehydrogenase
MLADMAAQLEAARLMVYRGAVEADRGRDSGYHVAMAKLVANQMCLEVISKSMQIHGAYGYTREFPVEKLMRDARMLPVGGGTTEIMREIVGRRLFES